MRGRIATLVGAGLVLVACGDGQSPGPSSSGPSSSADRPTPGSSAERSTPDELTAEQFCSDLGSSFLTVTARRTAGGVRVEWRDDALGNVQPVYRIYRRDSTAAGWRRVADLPAPAFGDPAPTSWVDRGSRAPTTQYGVTVVHGTCGEVPLCEQAPCATGSLVAARRS